MRTRYLYYLTAAFTCWLGSVTTARATHLLGAELAYEYAGTSAAPNRYHLTARIFSDGVNGSVSAPPTQVMVNCNPGSCSNGTGSVSATLNRTSMQPQYTSCNNGGLYYLILLDGLVDLPPAQWKLSFELTGRVSGMANVLQSGTTATYVRAELDNSSGLVDSSPRFTTSHLVYLTSVQPQKYSLNAFDPDGDSLAYQVVQPMGGSTAPQACGSLTVGALAPHFQLHPLTGELRTNSNGGGQLGIFAQAVRVTEYRKLGGSWQAIGSVMRDLTYYSTTAANHRVPDFTGVVRTGSPGQQLLGQPIAAVPGRLLDLTLTATDSTASHALTLSSDAVGIVPGLGFQNLGNGQGRLRWQVPPTLRPGRYTFTATVFDDGCPVLGHSVITLTFVVGQTALANRAGQTLAQSPYPTPFVDEVRFQLAGRGAQAVAVTDATGRVVAHLRSTPDGSVSWQPAPTLPAGLYFARTADGTQIARLAYAGR